MMTGHATVDTALSAMKLGAYDYLTKPCNLAEVMELIRKAHEKNRLKRENLVLQSLVSQRLQDPVVAPGAGQGGVIQDGIITRNAEMREVLAQVERVAP